MEKLTITVPEAAQLLGVSRAALDRLLAQADPQRDTSPR
jgi:hypothetical protein